MLGLTTTISHLQFSLTKIHLIPKTSTYIPITDLKSRYLLPLNSITRRNPRKLSPIYAETNGNGEVKSNGDEEDEEKKKGEGRPRFNMRWVDLVLDPDPNNVVAVGLTGLLTWASVQVLWQLFVISLAIVLAAIKYSFIAALLIFILITLL